MKPGLKIGGKYRLVRLLGEGGMGVVWAAVNELTEREVAFRTDYLEDFDVRVCALNTSLDAIGRPRHDDRSAAHMSRPSTRDR